MQARYYEKNKDNSITCRLCPHHCHLSPGKTGFCRVRHNEDGILKLPSYGHISALALDPIEKKPLYHFYPGKTILSAGFLGCNFRCPFCQNHKISQSVSLTCDNLHPAQLVNLALQKQSFALAYTYSEPLIHFEYLYETAVKARSAGLKNVLVSNGYINPEPAAELLEYLDAANIDLKAGRPGFYKEEIRGEVAEVKRFLKQAAGKLALEVTTLVIPGKNDSPEEIEALARFLGEIDPGIPLHLSCYYPTYRYSLPPTPPHKVFQLAETASRYLNYVYPGNVGNREVNTYCPECRNLLIRRTGYNTDIIGLVSGCCAKCGATINIVMEGKN